MARFQRKKSESVKLMNPKLFGVKKNDEFKACWSQGDCTKFDALGDPDEPDRDDSIPSAETWEARGNLGSIRLLLEILW